MRNRRLPISVSRTANRSPVGAERRSTVCVVLIAATLGVCNGSRAEAREIEGVRQVVEGQATGSKSPADVNRYGALSTTGLADFTRVLNAELQWMRFIASTGSVQEFNAQPDLRPTTCGPFADRPETAVWGEFTDIGKPTPLFLKFNCRIRHEDGPESELLSTPDTASLKVLCRDPASGRENAVFFTSAGASSSTIEVWGVDPPSGALKPLYMEGWGDLEATDTDSWGLDRLVSEDGACLWRNRQEARATVKSAMAALRVDPEENVIPAWMVPPALPTREIRAETARRWLKSLEGATTAAILEGAVYADAADRASWRVVQVLSTTRYEWEGVILLLDRRAGRWQAIFDVSLDYPMLGMVVKGNQLSAAVCVAFCYRGNGYAGRAEYETLVINLRTKRAMRLESRPIGNNPAIHDVGKELLFR